MNSFECRVNEYISTLRDCEISKAIAYAMEGGKRFRPRVIFSICKGMNIDESVAYDAALALELIQTYSLIHDDLPAMDNDDFRRGKPSLHKAFREDIAILTGDELLTESFGIVADSKEYDSDTKVKIISALSKYAGLSGMVYGQLLDVTSNGKILSDNDLFEIQDNKTSGLFKIASLIPMYINHEDNPDFYLKLGSMIGEIFQNQDDLFDLIKTEEEMGKSLSDNKNDKATALTLHSLDELQNIINEEFKALDTHLLKATFDTTYLKQLLQDLRNR